MLNVEVSKARIGKLESTLIVSRISAEALAGVVRAEAKLICTQRGRQQEIFYRNLAVKASCEGTRKAAGRRENVLVSFKAREMYSYQRQTK